MPSLAQTSGAEKKRVTMKDVTLRNGKTMTDAEFIKERGFGDALTEFVATKDDLKSLAHRLVREVLSDEFHLKLCSGRMPLARYDYLVHRFCRVMDFLPELVDEMNEQLSLGREKNATDIKRLEVEWEAEEKNNCGTKQPAAAHRLRGAGGG